MKKKTNYTNDDSKIDPQVLEAGGGIKKMWDLWSLGFSNRKITLKRLLNVMLAYAQWKIFRPKKSYAYPFKVIIDPTSICILHCPLCPTGQGNPGRNKGFMDVDKYKRLINEIAPYTIFIDFFNWGEPLLHKQFPEMVRYANKKGLVTRISTNLNFLNNKLAEDLVRARPDVVIMSIDGASQETYPIYRKGGDFNKVISNLKLIIQEKKRQNTKKPLLEWQFLVMKHNEHEIPKARAMAKKLGVDKIAFRPVRCDMSQEIFMTDEQKVLKTKEWLPNDDKLSRYDYNKKERKIHYKYCPHLWTKTAINWDGSISPCCAIYNKEFDFGNAFVEGSLKAVWNNAKYRKAREIIARQDKDINEKIVCKACLKTGYID